MSEKRLRPDGVSSRRFDRPGRGRPSAPADVPVGAGPEQEPLSRESADAPVVVKRFSGLGNRLLSRAIPLALGVMGVLGLLLAVLGYRTLLSSSTGTAIDPGTGADVASVAAAPHTETMVMAWVHNGALASVALLGLGGPGGSDEPSTSVLVFAAESQLGQDGMLLREVWAGDGEAGLAAALGQQFNIRIDHEVALASEGLAQIADGLPPLIVNLEESLISGGQDGSVTVDYLAGEVTVPAEELAQVAAWLNPTDNASPASTSARFARHRELWTGLGTAVKTEPSALGDLQVFGQPALDEAMARMLGALAGENARIELASGRWGRQDRTGATMIVDTDGVALQINQVVPRPRAAPGQERMRVRLVDGGGDDFIAAETATSIVELGGQIVTVGSLDRSGTDASRVVFHQPTTAADAAAKESFGVALQSLVGAELVEQTDAGADSFDFTVVIGTNLASGGDS